MHSTRVHELILLQGLNTDKAEQCVMLGGVDSLRQSCKFSRRIYFCVSE
jgi:hypothetical protein